MVLLRHLLGDVLRRLRLRQGRTLREVSAAARVSLGYLSEVERGQKEASSELLAAICTALGTPLSHVLGEVSDSFALAELQSEPVLAGVGERSAGNGRESAAHDLDAAVAGSLRGAGQPELRIPAGHARGMDSGSVLHPVALGSDHPAFDEVARRVRDATDMVPV
jgi:transcriptional regulator with XRE-family HTH domain